MATHQEAAAEAQASAGSAVEHSTSAVSEHATATTHDVHAADQVDPKASMAQPDTSAPTAEPAVAAPTATEPASSEEKPTTTTTTTTADTTAPAALRREQTEALGPATDEDITLPSSPASSGPALNINLMLTTGAKHPYKIDEKYLTSRGANSSAKSGSGEFDPKLLTGYKLKELIWTDWRREWEPRPASPSSIRLITMGKMIDDKKTLNDYNFDLSRTNVVHMTVKPADFGDDDDAAGNKHGGKGGSIRTRDGGEGGAGCRCVIL